MQSFCRGSASYTSDAGTLGCRHSGQRTLRCPLRRSTRGFAATVSQDDHDRAPPARRTTSTTVAKPPGWCRPLHSKSQMVARCRQDRPPSGATKAKLVGGRHRHGAHVDRPLPLPGPVVPRPLVVPETCLQVRQPIIVHLREGEAIKFRRRNRSVRRHHRSDRPGLSDHRGGQARRRRHHTDLTTRHIRQPVEPVSCTRPRRTSSTTRRLDRSGNGVRAIGCPHRKRFSPTPERIIEIGRPSVHPCCPRRVLRRRCRAAGATAAPRQLTGTSAGSRG